MNADEVVKKLRRAERYCLNEYSQMAGQAADLIESLQVENKRLHQWVNDLQSGMYVNCVYCGHRYGPEDKVPTSMADALKAHIEQCPEHPMSHLKSQLAESQRRAQDARNELCQKCGRYREAHKGACDGCRWKE